MSKERISPIEAFLAGTLIVGGTYGIGVAAKRIGDEINTRPQCKAEGYELSPGDTIETRYLNEEGLLEDRQVWVCRKDEKMHPSDAKIADKVVVKQSD